MNGFIIIWFNKLIDILNYINLVEIFKNEVFKFYNKKGVSERDIKSFAIDIFIVSKWVFICSMFTLSVSNIFSKWFAIYLLVMNIHTYFYHHVWSDNAIKGTARDNNHLRRRFLSLVLAIAYNIATYSYLYGVVYIHHFSVSPGFDTSLASVIHSISTTFTGSSDFLKPVDNIGIIIQISQTLISFLFLSIILSKSNNIKE